MRRPRLAMRTMMVAVAAMAVPLWLIFEVPRVEERRRFYRAAVRWHINREKDARTTSIAAGKECESERERARLLRLSASSLESRPGQEQELALRLLQGLTASAEERGELFRARKEEFARKAALHASARRKYEYAASHPWFPGSPGPPPSE